MQKQKQSGGCVYQYAVKTSYDSTHMVVALKVTVRLAENNVNSHVGMVIVRKVIVQYKPLGIILPEPASAAIKLACGVKELFAAGVAMTLAVLTAAGERSDKLAIDLRLPCKSDPYRILQHVVFDEFNHGQPYSLVAQSFHVSKEMEPQTRNIFRTAIVAMRNAT